MRLESCARATELKQALAGGQWPQAVSDDLRAHVRGCRNCRETILLATTFQEARTVSMAAARVGSPGLIWWRAQLRRRNEAMKRIAKPLIGAQIFAASVLLLAALTVLGFYLRQQGGVWNALKGLQQAVAERFALSSASTGAGWMLPLALLSALAVFGGAVVYFSSDRG